MKRLFLFLFAAILGISQMWGTVYAWSGYGTGSSSSMGTIEISTKEDFSNTTYSLANAGYFYFRAIKKDGYRFVGWYVGSSTAPSSWTALNAYADNPAKIWLSSSKTVYAFFEVDNTPSGDDDDDVTTPTAVDLGLSVKWADMNLGASSEGEYGNYYAWGKTTPATSFSSSDGSSGVFNDAATALLGGNWRTPTKEEYDELLSNCTWQWASSGGHYGFKVTGNGKTIFIPANGQYGTSLSNQNSRCFYWTSSQSGGKGYAFWSTTSMEQKAPATQTKYYGCGIRAVYDEPKVTYYVKHYKQNLDDDNYTLAETETKSAAAGASVTPGVKSYTGFTAPTASSYTVASGGTKEYYYTRNSYTITVVSSDNTLGTVNTTGGTYKYGKEITLTATETTGNFVKWSDENTNLSRSYTVSGTATITAIFENPTYSVTFRTSVSDPKPNVKSDYHYGDVIVNKPAIDPELITDEEDIHYYVFSGWYLMNGETMTETMYEDGMTVTGNMIFEPYFEQKVYDTDTITVNVTAGQGKVTLTYAGNTYTMNTAEDGNTKDFIIRNATGRLTAVATAARGYHVNGRADQALKNLKTQAINFAFAANTPLNLIEDHENADYTNELATNSAYAGKYLTVTVQTTANNDRTIANGNWATICLPFDYTITAEDAFYDQVYSLAEANVDANNIATLDFIKQTKMTAYVPYLIAARTDINKLEFDGVKLISYDNRSLLIREGNVNFVGTLYTQKVKNLDPANKTKFYIANSTTGVSLKFASSNPGVTLYGYRAYFEKITEDSANAPQRAVINLDGEEFEVEITEDGDIVPANATRKYIQDGRLIIERSGVKYNALGALAE